MDQIPLTAQDRTIVGRKVKALRRDGKIPAHIFGHNIKTTHISVEDKDFLTVNRKAGETGIVSLKIGKESKPVLIRATQTHPLTGQILHIDFYQVNLKEKVKVEIPIEIVGESPAVEKSEGLLLTPITEVEVEALPTELPESIKVDISNLEHIDDAVLIKDLKIPAGIKVFAEPDETVAKIGELVTKEMEEIEAEIESEKVEAVEETAETQDKESAEDKTEVSETPEQQE